MRLGDIVPADASILVVEDDPTIRELLEMLLRASGHRPIGAADGVAAIASTAQPDITVADFNLPNGPNGVEVIAMLREKFHREIPAIALTGDISTQTLRAISNLGCTHLDKPVETTQLLRAVAHLLAEPGAIGTHEIAVETSNEQTPATIFVVDDDAGIRDALQEILEAQGWRVETFASCEAFFGRIVARA